MSKGLLDAAVTRLSRLPSGRHYGASTGGDCWVMVGRDVRDVAGWSIVPPSASLTLAWGEGGCTVEFDGGTLQVRPGDWMWIDAGFVHRGENLPGSDFLTVFIPEPRVTAAALDLAPIGAAAQPAPRDLAGMLARLAALLLDGASIRATEAPYLDAILDWVGTTFPPRAAATDDGVALAAALIRDPRAEDSRIAAVARAVDLTPAELSRRFKERYRVTPEMYRKQVRLALATRELAGGGSITGAAHNAGFSDAAHFSRTFRHQYGITPSRWARQCAAALATGRPELA